MIEAIILKLCFGLEEMERLKQLPVYSNYVILAEVEEEEETESFFLFVSKNGKEDYFNLSSDFF
jgi:hypothetical protein